MKILRASASTDFCVTEDCRIVYHQEDGRKCLELGDEHWIPVVSWMRLRAERHAPEGASDKNAPFTPEGFHKLESSEQFSWVE